MAQGPSSRSIQSPGAQGKKLQQQQQQQQQHVRHQARQQPRRPAAPPPILKKSDSGPQGDRPKKTRLLLTSPGGQSVTRQPCNPPTPAGELLHAHAQKKSYFVAGKGGSSKRKLGGIMRHKSPAPSHQVSPKPPTPPSETPPDPSPSHQNEELQASRPQLLLRGEFHSYLFYRYSRPTLINSLHARPCHPISRIS